MRPARERNAREEAVAAAAAAKDGAEDEDAINRSLNPASKLDRALDKITNPRLDLEGLGKDF